MKRVPRYQRMAKGRITNYEMGYLREQGVWRDTRWQHLWASLSDHWHPASLADWQSRNDD